MTDHTPLSGGNIHYRTREDGGPEVVTDRCSFCGKKMKPQAKFSVHLREHHHWTDPEVPL